MNYDRVDSRRGPSHKTDDKSIKGNDNAVQINRKMICMSMKRMNKSSFHSMKIMAFRIVLIEKYAQINQWLFLTKTTLSNQVQASNIR